MADEFRGQSRHHHADRWRPTRGRALSAVHTTLVLFVKRLRVILLLVEATGGIAPAARAHIAKLARRSTGSGATDRTRYGGTRISTKSFYVHHSQMLSKAAVMHDAIAIRKQITCLKQRVGVLPRMRLTVGRVRKHALPPVSEKGPKGP